MPAHNKEWDARYESISDRIANFAKRYADCIASANEMKGNNLWYRIFHKILMFPSRYVLAFNAMKRINALCTQFSLSLLCSDHGINQIWNQQNVDLSRVFKEKFSGNTIPLFFSLASSALFTPALAYVINITKLLTFDYSGFVSFAFFGLAFMLIYNYFEYDRLRKDFKKEFEEILILIKELE